VPYLGGIAIFLSFLLRWPLTVEFQREVLGFSWPVSIVVILGLVDDLGALSRRSSWRSGGRRPDPHESVGP
jgi:UDP-N-acetylmuramyl pentapeptide phosphotransferase/UDP-N-acetylglucosamine-1-phosphate transferase